MFPFYSSTNNQMMKKTTSLLSGIQFLIRNWRYILSNLRRNYPNRKDFGSLPSHSSIAPPSHIGRTKYIFIEDYVKIRYGFTIINAEKESVYIKKYTEIAPDVTIVTNNHRATVSIPQVILGESHINDKSADVIIEEDVWIGTRATILAGVTLGRGCIVGANTLVNKSVPPYALVAGSPAKIIGVKFSLDDVEKHEKALYPPNERLSHEDLVSLFEKYYKDKKIYGCSDALTEEQINTVNKLKRKLELDL